MVVVTVDGVYVAYDATSDVTIVTTVNGVDVAWQAGIQDYTRGDEATLPANDNDLQTAFTAQDITDVATDNNVYVLQTALSTGEEFALFLFKDTHPDSLGTIILQCIAKSDIAPTQSTVFLQIFNRNSVTWETLDSDNVTAANVEFTLNGEQSANLADYYDASNIIAARVYQEAM